MFIIFATHVTSREEFYGRGDTLEDAAKILENNFAERYRESMEWDEFNCKYWVAEQLPVTRKTVFEVGDTFPKITG